jgi:hypothetical protein
MCQVTPEGPVMRAIIVVAALLLAVTIGVGLAVLLRPPAQVITLPPRALDQPDLADSRNTADSSRRALDSMIARLSGREPLPSTLRIGEPSLIVVVPDSSGLRPARAAVRRQLIRTLPGAARVAALYHMQFYVRSSTGLEVVGPDGVPIRGARVSPGDLGYVLAAPRYPAVRLQGIQGDSALADAAARYAALIGIRLGTLRPTSIRP